MSNLDSIINAGVAGLAGGAVLGSAFSITVMIITSVMGAFIGAVTQWRIDKKK